MGIYQLLKNLNTNIILYKRNIWGKADKIVHIVNAEEFEQGSKDFDQKTKLFIEKAGNNPHIKEIKVQCPDGKNHFILGCEAENSFIGRIKTYSGYWNVKGEMLSAVLGYKKYTGGQDITQFLTKQSITSKSPLKKFEISEVQKEFSKIGGVINPAEQSAIANLQPTTEYLQYDTLGETAIKKLKTGESFLNVIGNGGLKFETKQFLTEQEELANDIVDNITSGGYVKNLAQQINFFASIYGVLSEAEYDCQNNTYILTYARDCGGLYYETVSAVDALGLSNYIAH